MQIFQADTGERAGGVMIPEASRQETRPMCLYQHVQSTDLYKDTTLPIKSQYQHTCSQHSPDITDGS